jgi:putative spermidine/putrescine transport system substrate-binding protein
MPIALASATHARAQDSREVVFNGAGGSWQEHVRRAWLGPFAEQTGIRVRDTSPFDLGVLATMVRTRTVAYDVTDCPSAFLNVAIQRDLVEPIDYSIVDRSVQPPENFGDKFVAYGVFSANIVYDQRRLSGANVPDSWADFFDLQRFPGPRSFRRQPLITLEAALMADGVPPNKLYPLDLDRAFRKLESIKSVTRWWTNAEQSVQWIANGEAVMGMTFPNRAYAARLQGIPLALVWNQGLLGRIRLAVPKGAPNKANAMRLINFIIQAEQQARFANLNRSAPSNPRAFDSIDAGVASELATFPANVSSMVPLDELGFWREHVETVTRRFDAWLVA